MAGYEITSSGSTTVDIKITPNSSYSRYRVFVVNNSTDVSVSLPTETFDISSTKTITVSGLTANTYYRINVGYTNSSGSAPSVSGYFGANYFWTAPPKGSISNTSSTSSTIRVVGSTIEGAEEYNFYIRLSSTTSSTAYDSSSASYTFSGLSPGTEYVVNYQGLREATTSGAVARGATATAVYVWTLPEDPTIVSATATSKSAIKVTWNPAAGATQYSFYYLAAGASSGARANSVSYTTNSDGTLSYPLTGLSEGTMYHIYLYSYNANGDDCANRAYTTCYTQSDTSGYAYIYVSNKWEKATPYIWASSSWVKATPYVYLDGSWTKIGG